VLKERQVDGIMSFRPLMVRGWYLRSAPTCPCVIADRISANEPYQSVATDISMPRSRREIFLSLGHRHIALAANTAVSGTPGEIAGFSNLP